MEPSRAPQTTLALFGGAFDPPHVGHVLAVHYVLLTAPVDRVLVIPCGKHPFGKRQTPFRHRLAMCRLAFASAGETVEVLDMEGKRSGPSFTIDTVRELAQAHPEARLEMIVGSDNLREFPMWKEADRLRDLADLRILPRVEKRRDDAESAGDIPFHLPCVSSSTVRRMLRSGEDASPQLPRPVLDYIWLHGLYAAGPGGAKGELPCHRA